MSRTTKQVHPKLAPQNLPLRWNPLNRRYTIPPQGWPKLKPGIFIGGTRADQEAEKILQEGVYGSSLLWRDLTEMFVKDPLILTSAPILGRYSPYENKAFLWTWGDKQCKIYDGSGFTELTPIVNSGVQFTEIYSVDDCPDFWLICGAGGSPRGPLVKRLSHDYSTITTLSSGHVQPVANCRYSPGLGYFLTIDAVGNMRSYDGSTWVDKGAIEPHSVIVYDSDTDGTNIMIVGFDELDENPGVWMWNGTSITDLSTESGFSSGYRVTSVKYYGGVWLVGASSGELKLYDGSTWVLLKKYLYSPNYPKVVWDVSYGKGVWMIGGGDYYDPPSGLDIPFLEIYDGVTFTNILPGSGFIANIRCVEYFGINPPAEKVTLTIATTTGGTTTPAPGTYLHDKNSQVTVAAIPNTGYQFDHWDIDGSSNTSNPITLTMDKSYSLTAYFSPLGVSPWAMFHHDVKHTGYQSLPYSAIYVGSHDHYLYAINSDGTLRWRYETGHIIFYSSPAVGSDGTIYVGSDDHYLHAVNSDGTLKWKYETGSMVTSSPAIGSDGTIYVGSNDYYLYAINPNGTLKWRYLAENVIDISSPAIGSDGTIYIGSVDGYLYAINPDGTLKWRYLTDGLVYSSPAIGSDGTIYVGSDDSYLYAINPDGTLKWRYLTGGSIYSSPAIGSDGTIYVGSYDHYLYAINPDGTLKWRYETGDVIYFSSPAIGSDGTIYIGSWDSYLYAINPDGTLKWRYLTGSSIDSSPAVGSDGTIYVGGGDFYLYAINPNGTLKWRYLTGNLIDSSPALS